MRDHSQSLHHEGHCHARSITLTFITSLTLNFRWIKEFFAKADKDKDRSLTLKEVEKVLPEMGIDIKKSHIEILFEVSRI
jgi:Ca2+-binding EF-hand superfamily protein